MEPPIDDSLPMQQEQEQEPVYYYQSPRIQKKVDIFSDMDKTMLIMLLAVFIIGFFMGKSMTPIILKSV
jgi:cell division protein FtsL